MVILLNSYGQRSNNLFQHIHLDSFCKENNIYLYNKYVQILHKDYPNIEKNNAIIDLCLKAKIPQSMYRIKLATYINFADINKISVYKDLIINRNLVCGEGWFFRSYATALKYRSFYQHLFKPNVDETFLYQEFLQKTSSTEKNIGVHIRRGDYNLHEGGKFFYNDAVYIDKLNQISIDFKKRGLNCRFILFSNDDLLNVETYRRSFNTLIISRNSPLIDQYLMSQCDYLIGPPSTFTGWANYIGGTPYYHINEADSIVTLDSFITGPYITG